MFYMDILQNEKKDFYLGYSADLRKRVVSHNVGLNRSTAGALWQLVYYETYVTETSARKREASLKRNRRMKTVLLQRIKQSLE